MDDAATGLSATTAAPSAAPAGGEESVSALRLAVMANRMDAICREMTNIVLHSARSAVIGIARDFSCAIITADHEVLATAEAMPIHVFGMNIQTAIMGETHPDFREGDAFLDNDPYGGNSHAADHTILVPVFHEGRARLHGGRQGSPGRCRQQPADHLFRRGAGRLPRGRADLPLRPGAAGLSRHRRHRPHVPAPHSGAGPVVRRLSRRHRRGPDRRAGGSRRSSASTAPGR